MSFGTSDFKKLYCQHVQENVDLKKYIRGLECAKQRRVQEIDHNQTDFKRKYQKYIDGSLNPCSRKETLNPLKIENRIHSNRLRASLGDLAVVTKNHGVTMPVDFPYSFHTWHNMVDTGCKDSSGRSPLEITRDSILREPVPEISTPRGRSSGITSGSIVKEEFHSEKDKKGDIKNITVRWHPQHEKPLMSLRKEHSNCKKKGYNSVKIIAKLLDTNVNEVKNDLTNKNSSIKLPQMVSRSKTNITNLQNKFESHINPGNAKNLISTSLDTDLFATRPVQARSARRRSKSLAPGMLTQFQKRKQTISVSIEEDDKLAVARNRSSSITEFDNIRKRMKSTIRNTTSVDKAALRIMMENSKGIQKFKYLSKLVNAGLKEMREPDDNETLKKSDSVEINTCRYLRTPRINRESDKKSGMSFVFDDFNDRVTKT